MKTNRFGGELEHRAFEVAPIKGRTLEGHAAVFNSPAKIGNFTETIAPGAFTRSLASGSDILGLADHDMSKLLGRTKSGSLKLAEDSQGLAFSLTLPDTAAGRDVIALAERGDLGGMSFGFRLNQDGESWNGNKRTLRSVALHEVSVISSWPAYERTAADLALRHDAYEQRRMTGVDFDLVSRRARILCFAEMNRWL